MVMSIISSVFVLPLIGISANGLAIANDYDNYYGEPSVCGNIFLEIRTYDLCVSFSTLTYISILLSFIFSYSFTQVKVFFCICNCYFCVIAFNYSMCLYNLTFNGLSWNTLNTISKPDIIYHVKSEVNYNFNMIIQIASIQHWKVFLLGLFDFDFWINTFNSLKFCIQSNLIIIPHLIMVNNDIYFPLF